MRSLSQFFFIAALSAIALPALTQSHQLKMIWQTDTVFKVPESALLDPLGKTIYVSCIDGQPAAKDGKGSIGKMTPTGKVLSPAWIKGLNAPKGMGMHQQLLYVADLSEVVVIDTRMGVIVKRIAIPGATFLNDVSVSPDGVVYVTDSNEKKVHKIEGDKVSIAAEGFTRPNGVLWQPDGLFVLDNGSLLRINGDQKTTIATGMESSTDGVERVNGKDFVISCWSGVVYYVKADGHKETLVDTKESKINAADIGYHDQSKTVFVPTFWNNRVVAYRLETIQ